jgi:TonB family protein
MKRMLCVLLFLPLLTIAQKIKVNEYDKFIKQQRVVSDPIDICSTPKMKLSVCLSAIGSNMYIQLIGAGAGAYRIEPEDQVIFLMDNDSTITVKSKGYQGYELGTTTSSTYKHQYILTYADLQKLSQNNLAALRKYHADEYDDVNVPKESSQKFKLLCALFIVELLNSNMLHLVESNVNERATNNEVSAVMANVQMADTTTTLNRDSFSKVKKDTLAAMKPDTLAKVKTAEKQNSAPAFPGGIEAWSTFLRNDLYPHTPLQEGEVKEALVQFQVAADGSVSDLKILESAGLEFDKELLRVLKRTPKWKPAIENGKAVNAMVTQRIVFVDKYSR